MAYNPTAPGTDATVADGPTSGGDKEIKALTSLHDRLVDTLGGYDKVLEKAEPEFVPVVREFRDLHQGQSAQVMSMLIELGHDPEGEGSLMGTVNRAVVEVRSWFDDVGHNVLSGIVDGEKRLMAKFDEVIDASPSIERRGRIEAMRADTRALVQRHAPGEV